MSDESSVGAAVSPTPEEAAAAELRWALERKVGAGTGMRLLAALDVLVAALRDAREWMTPFEGSGIEWHEGLPSPYTYQASDFSKLLVAVHEYEARALRAERERDQARDALAKIDGHPYADSVPAARSMRVIARAAFGGAAEQQKEDDSGNQ